MATTTQAVARFWFARVRVARAGCWKSINRTTGSASPVSPFTSTCALKISFWISSLDSNKLRLTEDLAAQVFKLPVGQPRIDRPHRLTENLRQEPLAEILPQARRRVGRNHPAALIDDFPSRRGKLVEEGFLDVEALGHGYAKSSCASVTHCCRIGIDSSSNSRSI